MLSVYSTIHALLFILCSVKHWTKRYNSSAVKFNNQNSFWWYHCAGPSFTSNARATADAALLKLHATNTVNIIITGCASWAKPECKLMRNSWLSLLNQQQHAEKYIGGVYKEYIHILLAVGLRIDSNFNAMQCKPNKGSNGKSNTIATKVTTSQA